MPEAEVPLVPERFFPDGHSRVRVRIGHNVHRTSYRWSAAVLDLLQHLEREGFTGAPRASGFDDQGREVLSYVDGEVANQRRPGHLGGGDLPEYVWRDEVLVHLGGLVRAYHDAAATFAWDDREWCYETRHPVETVCHNEIFPMNTVFRSGVPVAFIDWDTATPGPRAWDLGFIACVWVPFWSDAKCRAAGLSTGVADKVRRFRLLLDAYGVAPDISIAQSGVERLRGFLEQQRRFAAEGSEWEMTLDRRGVLDETASDIAWIDEHAAELAGS